MPALRLFSTVQSLYMFVSVNNQWHGNSRFFPLVDVHVSEQLEAAKAQAVVDEVVRPSFIYVDHYCVYGLLTKLSFHFKMFSI